MLYYGKKLFKALCIYTPYRPQIVRHYEHNEATYPRVVFLRQVYFKNPSPPTATIG